MRILVGMPEKGAQGGPIACEPPFIEEVRRLGHDVDEEVYAYASVNVTLGARIRRVLKTRRALRARLRQGSFDLVHINTAFDVKALLRDAVIVPHIHSSGTKLFLKFHGSEARLLQTRNPLLSALRHRVLSHADGIGVLSSAERTNFLRAGLPEDKVFTVKNVVPEYQSEERSAFLRNWNLPGDLPLLLFIGRFIPAKGLLDVIQAAALLRDAGEKFLLLCVGGGPDGENAERSVARLHLNDQVHFFGYLPENQTRGFYGHATALVFPTYHEEGFPMVVFNAAAAGLPVLTTRIRAASDYLREPDNCLWVEPNNPQALAARMGELLANPSLRATMSANNRKLASGFSATAVTREYIQLYERLRG